MSHAKLAKEAIKRGALTLAVHSAGRSSNRLLMPLSARPRAAGFQRYWRTGSKRVGDYRLRDRAVDLSRALSGLGSELMRVPSKLVRVERTCRAHIDTKRDSADQCRM